MVSNTAGCNYNRSGSVQHSWCSEEMTKGFTAKSLKAFYCTLEINYNWGSEDSRVCCTFTSLTSFGSVWDTENKKPLTSITECLVLDGNLPRGCPGAQGNRWRPRLRTPSPCPGTGRSRLPAAPAPAADTPPRPPAGLGRGTAGRRAEGRAPPRTPPREGLHSGAGLGAGSGQKSAEALRGGGASWLRGERGGRGKRRQA